MKILVAKFQLEANEHVDMKCDLPNVALSYGRDALSHMQVGDVFDDPDIELVPVICADAACSGVMKKTCFDYIEQTILNAVRDNLRDLDGIYLHLHGASYVEEIGSGEHHLVAAIRQIVGPYLPLAVSCDPHGNLTKEYVENTTFIRSYREAPHTDIAQTVQRTYRALIELIRHRQNITPVYRKLPLILGGEQSVSADEPVRSFNQYMDEMEKDPRILSASWHVGYIRHDTDVAGCGVVVVPNSEADQDYAEQKVDELAAYVWERRHEFHYTGLTQEPEEAIQSALNCPGKPVFLTDSGDNTTSGSVGANTWVLRQVMALPDTKGKNFLFGCITDPAVVAQLADVPEGTKTHIRLGMDLDELSRPVELDVTVKHKGRLEGFMGYEGDYGACVLVSVEGYPIDIIVAEASHAVVELHQFEAAGAHCADYGVVIVKQGYIFPELKELGALCVMSLTDGATLQDTRRLPFKRIMRPMFPVDDI